MKTNVCYLGDCLNILPTLPDNSVDSIVTDPPYGIGFMGKKWDTFKQNNRTKNQVVNMGSGMAFPKLDEMKEYQAWCELWSRECLRVLKPGGHLLSFSGTRTYHRMAVAIEDAGFEVRDMIEWVYGSGFPKSLNIGKAVDKIQGNKRDDLGFREDFRKRARKNGVESKDYIMAGGWKSTEDTVGKLDRGHTEYEGWGTALKPAHEPICLARKPLQEKTVAENVLKYGTGGINIDESRVGFQKGDEPSAGNRTATFGTQETVSGGDGSGGFESNSMGRFPANLIHDNSEEVRECFPDAKGASSQNNHSNGKIYRGQSLLESETKLEGHRDWYNDNGNASRFFKSILYYPKASKSERNKGCEELEDKLGGSLEGGNDTRDGKDEPQLKPTKNNHPTVKPIALMSYLIKMITPKGGTVLEPFAGSGSTLVAARDNGFQYIGIEMTEEYLPIIQARTGCEIIKNARIVAREIREEQGKNLEIAVNTVIANMCPECGGKIKGKYCEDCFWEIESK